VGAAADSLQTDNIWEVALISGHSANDMANLWSEISRAGDCRERQCEGNDKILDRHYASRASGNEGLKSVLREKRMGG